ncbi:hypothetical protein PUNSTDRAFT_134643 [Punctularia strigosozonata HHB-11173 SS5]|uniref:uncharacterized protein n=1 Tax=Punctularia strigosozonata (strain HHB-11173) TaxID=741275 RepID=UPI0004416D22|nr:uncharacterized protein PUNSTDRAFT_134643 [Punctularia strigosozonata HHB-11173 SS5]EIN08251.1 hypothetical protein PUNSTDRAFT_134643 [Punctularia strigosozonata HHB-11173 SS5]
MATKTQPASATSSRFPLFKRFGLKSPTRTSHNNGDDEWYIPYNGPYELPKEQPKPIRDSWGDIVGDAFAAHRDLFESSPSEGKSRSRAFSHTSHQTGSSGAIDPSRKSFTTSVRLRASSPPRMPVPSFASMDAGGIGATPIPRTRSPTSPTSPGSNARMSFASIFGLGSPQSGGASSGVTKTPSMPTLVRAGSFGRPRAGSEQPKPVSGLKTLAPSTKATAPKDEYRDIQYNSLSRTPTASRPDINISSVPHPPSPDKLDTPTSSSHVHSSQQTHTSKSSHPYASAAPVPTTPTYTAKGKGRAIDFPDRQSPPPQPHTVRLALPSKSEPVPPYLQPSAAASKTSILGSLSRLKTSLSTPNLRSPSKTHLPAIPQLSTSGDYNLLARDRWLSAETWCDALLFPRPRFKVRQGPSTPPMPRRAHVVSPPPDIIWPAPGAEQYERARVAGARPRVGSLRTPTGNKGLGLHKSRSQADIGVSRALDVVSASTPVPAVATVNESALERLPPVNIREEQIEEARFRGNVLPSGFLSPRDPRVANDVANGRSKRFSWDDMALPSPVPSLSKVLEDGERLERDRRAWQAQAKHSLLNNRTRSISRTRAKSLSKSKARAANKDNADGRMDFLAERTLLGTQGLKPTVHVVFADSSAAGHVRQSASVGGTATATTSHTRSHSHSSHSKTDASASQRGHRRAESLGRGIKRAGALCGLTGAEHTYDAESVRGAAIDAVLRSGGTKVIHLEDQIVQERTKASGELLVASSQGQSAEGTFQSGLAPSPTPSGVSGSGEGVRMGIAISSPIPPSSDDHSQEPIHMPNHPYAMPTSRYPRPQRLETSDGKGALQDSMAVQSQVPPAAGVLINDISARHRLPPQATLPSTTLNVPHISHPYASYGVAGAPDLRDVSPSRTMFAEVGAGYVRQILPEEIRYSPMPPEDAPFEGENWAEHVYAYRQDSLRQEDRATLRMEDALSMTLKRRRSKERLKGNDGSSMDDRTDPVDVHSQPARMIAHDSTPPEAPRVQRKPVPDGLDGSPPVAREGTQLSLPRTKRTMASSPSDHANPPESRPELLRTTSEDSQEHSGSSPGVASENTSPPLSPRRMGSSGSEDLDRFRDLFYRPARSQQNGSAAPSIQKEVSEARPSLTRKPSRSVPVDVSQHSSLSGSGLANLTRMLSEELEATRLRNGRSMISDASSWDWSAIPHEEDTTDHIAELLDQMSYPQHASSQSLTMRAPLKVAPAQGSPLLVNVPEDVESSRASSPLDPSNPENPADTFGALRFGIVEAVSTPPAVTGSRPMSGHLSLVQDDVVPEEQQAEDAVSPTSQARTHSSLMPQSSTFTRSSYLTTTSDGSRISALSDFPSPPTDVTPAHMPIIQSYFAGYTPRQELEDPISNDPQPAEPRIPENLHSPAADARASRRTTFGEDAFVIDGSAS